MLPDILIFGSERLILQKTFHSKGLRSWLGGAPIRHLAANHYLCCAAGHNQLTTQVESLNNNSASPVAPLAYVPQLRRVEDSSRRFEQARASMRRCTRCILPETMPFIKFDEQGVCSYCHSYQPMKVRDTRAVLEVIAARQSANPDANALVMLSGGRDSCYGLHYAVKELGLRPIAYTYDWGLVTDIARRNAARMCGSLGVEHIIVSADIAWKRANVRKNIIAWLKRPQLGMVPLFMAGDKQYFYYANQISRANNLPLALVSENPMELTRFKAGFCGVDESSHRIFNIPWRKKLHLAFYYLGQYLANPRYLNSTLADNLFAFAASYVIKHNYMHIFHYTKWREEEINSVLLDQYGWEIDSEAQSTWRIGDGTAAFYNYIYYTMAGLTENDTLRSNQIREGMLQRQEALAMVERENRPRWNSLQWYASVIGFNLVETLMVINNAPKLYYQ
jgi:hypothetical protein